MYPLFLFNFLVVVFSSPIVYTLYCTEILTQHFEIIEHNPAVQKIPTVYADELTALTKIIERFNCNPAVGFWYLYWHDLYLNNKDIKSIAKHEEVFNPSSQTAIAFQPMGRKQTDAFLNDLGENVLGKKQSEHLDRLFQKIDEIHQLHPVNQAQNGALLGEEKQNVTNKYVVTSPPVTSHFVGFAVNPVAKGANPSNVALIDPTTGAAVWIDENTVVTG